MEVQYPSDSFRIFRLAKALLDSEWKRSRHWFLKIPLKDLIVDVLLGPTRKFPIYVISCHARLIV